MLHNPVVLIDGNSLVTRAVKATERDDKRAGGIATGGVYGSISQMRRILAGPLRNRPVGHIFAFFDAGVPVRRRLILPWYKEDRKRRRQEEDPADRERLSNQMAMARKMFESLGVRCLSFKNREADDCIAAAADYLSAPFRDSRDPGWDARPVIVTGDRDLYQCVVWSGARVWDLNRKRMITLDNFQEVTEVEPNLFLLCKAFAGDVSDSLPGVRGCGIKRAHQLLMEVMEQRPGLAQLSTDAQLDGVIDYVQAKASPYKHEVALVEDVDRIKREIHGIDLRDSFGDSKVLIKALRPGKIDAREFLRLSVQLRLTRFSGDPARWLRQFRRPFQPRKVRV
jgi:DNA polymerase I